MNNVYEQAGDYMPRTDDGFWHWLQNFSSLLSENPQRYAMTAADAQIVMDHFNAYTPLWTQCTQPTLRTPKIIAQKDAVKAAAMGSCRVYAMIIKHTAGVAETDKIALGLHIDDTTPSPIDAPSTAPMLQIVCAYSGQHILRYADESTPNARRKPAGVKLLELRCNFAQHPDPTIATAKPAGLHTRQPIKVTLDQAHTGQTATYFGRWVTARGLVGPWSLPVAMTVSFGGPLKLSGSREENAPHTADEPAALKIAA